MIDYELIGWIGGIFFAICAIPQAIQSYKDKHSNGLSWSFLILWTIGEILTLIYTLSKPVDLWPLIFNYTFNLLAISVIIWYKIPKKK